jgi:hypothetical protein
MIKTRKVFYVSGYDPRGLRYYRELFQSQLEKYNNITSSSFEVSEKTRINKNQTSWSINEKEVESNSNSTAKVDYSFLHWDDVVRQSWLRNPFKLGFKALQTYFHYFTNLRWDKVLPIAKKRTFGLLYPIITFFLFWVGSYFILTSAANFIGLTPTAVLKTALFLLAYIPAALLLDKIKTLWLLRFFIFNVENFHLSPEKLNPRIEDFSASIITALNDPKYDEVLLISHSNGTILSIPLLNKIFSSSVDTSKLKILTLGQCLLLTTYYKNALQIKQNLEFLSKQDLTWFDISSPADNICFPFLDPFMPNFPPSETRAAKAVMLSPAFHKYYEEKKYKRLKRNKFLLHFQYLYCADRPSPYNFFNIITSPTPLAETIGSKK